jgi:hypothetical protein
MSMELRYIALSLWPHKEDIINISNKNFRLCCEGQNDDKIMGSFDVVSLFTTTPVDKSLAIVKVKLQEDITLKDRTNLSV